MKKYIVGLKLTEKILGTVPKNRNVYTEYIESKKPKDVDGIESETVPVDEAKGWTGFHEDEDGLFVYDYLIKGFLKYAANVVKDMKGVNTTALKKKVGDIVFVRPRKIYFIGKDKPDGVEERPLRAQTMQGPRVTLAKSDYLNAGTKLRFELHVLKPGVITDKILRAILDYGQYQGLGQWRNAGHGSFVFTLEEVK